MYKISSPHLGGGDGLGFFELLELFFNVIKLKIFQTGACSKVNIEGSIP
jgi:hypothetical protein